VRLSLADIRKPSYGSKLFYNLYHPRSWEQKKDTDNRFHTLYFSSEIVDEWEADRKSRRKNTPKRYWVRKKGDTPGHWQYRYRHGKEEVEISGLSKTIIIRDTEMTEPVVKKIYISDFDISNPPTVENKDADEENTRKVATGALPSYRRGGKAQGRTYIIRREIFHLLVRDKNLFDSSVITPEQLNKDRGKLRKVTILMPDFSLAIKQLLLREDGLNKDGEMEYAGLLLKIKKEFSSPIDILKLFPHRGPYSGESRHLITKILNAENSHIKEFDAELQALIDVTWRSVLSKLLEMNYWHRKKLAEEVVEEAEEVVEEAEETNRCEKCDSTEVDIDRKRKLIICKNCGKQSDYIEPHLIRPQRWNDVKHMCGGEDCTSMEIDTYSQPGFSICLRCGLTETLPPEADAKRKNEAESDAGKNPNKP
jgi:transcription elongation factor Elf1